MIQVPNELSGRGRPDYFRTRTASHQLADRFAVEEGRDWPAGVVRELMAVVDTEVAIDRRE